MDRASETYETKTITTTTTKIQHSFHQSFKSKEKESDVEKVSTQGGNV